MTSGDYRQFKRFGFDKPVELYPVFPVYEPQASDPAPVFLPGRLRDIGRGGVGLVTDIPFRVGSILKLHFELKRDHWIEVFGKIAWSQGETAGVQFFSLTGIPQRIIHKYILDYFPC